MMRFAEAEYAAEPKWSSPQNPRGLTKRDTSFKPSNGAIMSDIDIIDIQSDVIEMDLKEEIYSMLKPAKGPRKMPTLLLYDERGLQIFEKITYLNEYYLTNAEIDVLNTWGWEMAQNIQSGTMVVELGSGNLRKVRILLEALEAAGKEIHYYALDLSLRELERTLAAVPQFQNVKCHGLHGTYSDGLAWLKSNGIASRPKCILSLGSSIGNFSREEAALFLKDFADILRPCDTIIVGVDACNDPAKVYHAYNDRDGVTHEFVLNGLRNANHILGAEIFNVDDWKVIGEYVHDIEGGRHQAFYSPTRDVKCLGILIEEGERVQIEQSLKYSDEESRVLWKLAGLKQMGKWSASGESYSKSRYNSQIDDQDGRLARHIGASVTNSLSELYGVTGQLFLNTLPARVVSPPNKYLASVTIIVHNVHLLTKRDMPFHLDPSRYASLTVPTIDDWRGLWSAWDTVTRGMIPEDELLNKPIKLRNACIFYLGHIPTFLDLQLSKATKQPLSEPSYYPRIFERGIDPDVDNPDHCHDHSEIPEEWPPLKEILGYQGQVRAKVESLYEEKCCSLPRKTGRALWIGFEHEIMHLETLLYMLLQSDRTQPPPRTIRPDFEKDAEIAAKTSVPNRWFTIPEQIITIGMDDPEDNSGPDHHFGWDNEKPRRTANVHSFEAKARPITNEEYAWFLEATGNMKLPASWTTSKTNNMTNGAVNISNGTCLVTNGSATASTAHGYQNGHVESSIPPERSYLEGIAVRTVHGLVPLKYALGWPVFASYDELSSCATWMGGRIPTMEEARSIYSHVDGLKLKEAEQHLGKTVPAVNGHLLHDGVEESPPSRPSVNGKGSHELFTNLENANVGFTHWHPVAVTPNGNRLAGQGEMGGVWEWTSSPLERHEGFEPMPLYPAYTADFFDGKHNVVLGGSWATHPRIAGRKTFVNWYQRNYPYAWIGARLVRDL